jgi:hypothetical protein
LAFDATMIEARVQTLMEKMHVEIQSTSTFDVKGRDEHPLAEWVWNARRLLERNCATK